MTNDELILLIAKDDEHAFTELYNRFWKILFAIAYNRLKNIGTAEDVVHDVFTSIWKNRHHLKVHNIEKYLASSIKYLVLAQVKKAYYANAYLSQSNLTNDTNIEDSVHYKAILNMVKEGAAELPEKCRLVFKYSREYNMTSKQIAEELNISQKTVENHLNKALQYLRLRMKQVLRFLFL